MKKFLKYFFIFKPLYNRFELVYTENMEEINFYDAVETDKDAELIAKSGHGGGDYITARMFIECLEENREPEHPFNIKAAIAMSSTAILAHRSMLEGGRPYAIPDFDDPDDCLLYENDYLSPFYRMDGSEPSLPCCSHKDYRPSDNQIKNYLQALGLDDENNSLS